MATILFWTFIALNLCQKDSKVQDQNPVLKNHHSIAVDKSNTMGTLNRVYAKVGNAFLKRYDFFIL